MNVCLRISISRKMEKYLLDLVCEREGRARLSDKIRWIQDCGSPTEAGETEPVLSKIMGKADSGTQFQSKFQYTVPRGWNLGVDVLRIWTHS